MRQPAGSVYFLTVLHAPHGKMSERRSRTLFVRNLPFSASNEKLTEAFEQVGPIKTAFVVVDKGKLLPSDRRFVKYTGVYIQ